MRYEILLTRKAVKELEGLEPQLRNRFIKRAIRAQRLRLLQQA